MTPSERPPVGPSAPSEREALAARRRRGRLTAIVSLIAIVIALAYLSGG